MKVKSIKLWVHLLVVIAMLSLLVVGCEDETAEESPAPTTPVQTSSPQETLTPTPTIEPSPTVSPEAESEYPDEAPKLPPSFGLDSDVFSSLPDVAPSSDTFAQGAILASIGLPGQSQPFTPAVWGDQSYWNHAAGNVLVWSAIIVVGLAVPVAAFAASFQNIPYKENDRTWIWEYSVNIGGKKHTAELQGAYIPEGVEWEMRISKKGEYTDFLWYNGQSNLGGTEGYWIMKENPSKPNDLLRIDWERDPYEQTNEIKYTNIKPGGPENGGYIRTSVTNDTPYDASWDIYNKGQDNHTYIEWNRSTEKGRVKDSKRFSDSQWHCWGSDHKNLDVCP